MEGRGSEERGRQEGKEEEDAGNRVDGGGRGEGHTGCHLEEEAANIREPHKDTATLGHLALLPPPRTIHEEAEEEGGRGGVRLCFQGDRIRPPRRVE